MNIGKFCPLPLCALTGNFRIYLYIVSLVVILSNWVCDNWVYQIPTMTKVDKLGTGDLFAEDAAPAREDLSQPRPCWRILRAAYARLGRFE